MGIRYPWAPIPSGMHLLYATQQNIHICVPLSQLWQSFSASEHDAKLFWLCTAFVTTFAPEILNVYFRQVDLFVSGQAWLSQKCQYQIFTFFSEWYVSVLLDFFAFRSDTLLVSSPNLHGPYSKPHFETLVSSFVFPQLSFNATKQNLWESDPVDYVRISVGSFQ